MTSLGKNLEALREKARDLNRLSDAANDLIDQTQTELERMNLGVFSLLAAS